jgi:hypothetical protein
MNRNDPKNRPENPVADILMREIDRLQPRSIEEMNLIARDVSDRYNRTAQPEIGGLSPEQVSKLIYGDWLGSAVVLNEQLTLAELAGAPILVNGRRLLNALGQMGTAKATATGAFNRKFATQMFTEFDINTRTRESAVRLNKVFNQIDVPYLEMLRHLLPQAGLLLFRKGEFRLTKRAIGLLPENKAGELFALLFRTLLLRFNLAALDGLPEAPALQHTAGYTLYQLSKRANDWLEVPGCGMSLLLPKVVEELPELSWTPVNGSASDRFCDIRMVMKFRDMGLIEYDNARSWPSPDRFRKAPLFDRFLSFNLPAAFPHVVQPSTRRPDSFH